MQIGLWKGKLEFAQGSFIRNFVGVPVSLLVFETNGHEQTGPLPATHDQRLT